MKAGTKISSLCFGTTSVACGGGGGEQARRWLTGIVGTIYFRSAPRDVRLLASGFSFKYSISESLLSAECPYTHYNLTPTVVVYAASVYERLCPEGFGGRLVSSPFLECESR